MLMSVQIYEKRILRRLDLYRSFADEAPSLTMALEPAVFTGEEMLGVYQNPDARISIFVSTYGLRVQEENDWRFLPYTEILHVEFPHQKIGANGLRCVRKDNIEFYLPIGNIENDIFEFMRFLDRVLHNVIAASEVQED